jgi:hypothetical protein
MVGIIDMITMDIDVNQIYNSSKYLSLFVARKYNIEGDPSVRTYTGHSVGYTLIRSYFSPPFTTGQKYIITGSSDGGIRS